MSDRSGDNVPRRRSRGFGFPLALLAAGTVALLANFGYLGAFSWARLLALWPLILILIGIDLLLAHRAPLVALAADAIVIVLGLALVLTQPGIASPFIVIGDPDCGGDRQAAVAASRDGTKEVSVRIAAGATSLGVGGSAAGLLEATSTAADLRLTTRTPRSGSSELRLDQCFGASAFGRGGSNQMHVKLASDVPLSLEVSAGAATIDLDLRGTAVADVRLSTGAATVSLFLPKPNGDLRVTISSGASTINVHLPPGVESRAMLSGGLSSLNGSGGFGGRDVSETPGYAGAKDRVSVTVNAGMSTVNVR